MIDIGRNDGAAQRYLVANEFCRYEFRDFGPKTLARRYGFARALMRLGAAEILAMGDKAHPIGDDPGAG